MTDSYNGIQSGPPTEYNRQGGRFHFRDLLNETAIQPEVENMSKCYKFMVAIDIFQFIPVPQTRVVSTKRSKCGSIFLILIFVGYVIYDFVSLLLNNPPKVNSYEVPLDSIPYQVPQMAIGFIYGPDLNNTLNNSNYFNISLLEINTTYGKGTAQNATMFPCQQLPWLQNLQTFYQNLSCIDTNSVSLSGLLYASPDSLYPRFVVNGCNYTANPNCVNASALANMTGGGRIFLFIQKTESVNLATLKKSQSQTFGTFYFYNFFLVPGLYNRITITIQPTTYIVFPDYITSFTKKQYLNMPIVDQQFQTSNVSSYNPYDMLSISVLLSAEQRINYVVYSTLIEHVSLWGAFWGVLFSLFAFYFLMFNRKLFYQERPEWNRFEEKVKELEEQRKRYERRLIELSEQNSARGSHLEYMNRPLMTDKNKVA